MNKTFPLAHRFMDGSFAVLTEAQLRSMHVLSAGRCACIWRAFVSAEFAHLAARPRNGSVQPKQVFEIDWKREQAEPEAVADRIGVEAGSTLVAVHLWSSTLGVRVPLSLFFRFWSDFWHWSDENCVLLIPRMRMRIEYADEKIFVFGL